MPEQEIFGVGALRCGSTARRDKATPHGGIKWQATRARAAPRSPGTPCRPTCERPASFGRRGGASRGSSPCGRSRSEEHTSELQSLAYLVCRLLLEKKKKTTLTEITTG